MRLASWNVNSLRVRMQQLRQFVDTARPDVLCLQETKVEDDKFPELELRALGYEHLAWWGGKTYNGVAILSNRPVEAVRRGFSDGPADPEPRLLQAVISGVRVMCCYVPNGQEVSSPKFRYKLSWMSRLKREIREFTDLAGPVLVCGDFNVARTERDVWDPFLAEGQVLYHPMERDALDKIVDLGLVDTWRTAHPEDREYSWWDYQKMGWQRNHGMRIDYVFVTPSLWGRCREPVMWRDARGWDKPSDHVPLTIEIDG